MLAEYIKRRKIIKNRIGSGVILLPGNNYTPMNYPSNPLPFRQDSHLLYFTGIEKPGIFLLLDCDNGEEIIFGNDPDVDDTIWTGPQISIITHAKSVGINKTMPAAKLKDFILSIILNKREIHYLPPYPSDRKILLSNLLGKPIQEIEQGISTKLIREIVNLRSVKSENEIAEIETALNTTGRIYNQSLINIRSGLFEYDIVANISKIVRESNVSLAYPAICTVHGEILHNETYKNQLEDGHLILIDAGAESPLHYASDITRTFPVSGKFDLQQKEIYELVLNTQLKSIESIKPGVRYADIHLLAAKNIIFGLQDLGLMKGNVDEALKLGAHALFFPHGLGHMLGLDVHDMEDLGEDYVGYAGQAIRSDQFGMAYLRLARELEPGFVITVEPGIYFIPLLIDSWQSENKFPQFINYKEVLRYKNFGGIRIEDNILVTKNGYRVLGNPIPKTISEIENYMN